MTVRLEVEPSVIQWLRNSVGASEEDAARRAGTSLAQYQRLEAGEARPTIGQLRSLAKSYRQPFGLFLSESAPKAKAPLPRDFRGHQGVVVERNDSSLAIQINNAERRREIAIGLIEDIGEEPTHFVFRLHRNENPEVAGESIRHFLGLNASIQRRWRTGEKSLSELKSIIEASGVLIGQFTRLDIDQARGASLSVFPLPIIILNPKDSPVARTFTLLHEFVHIALRASGVCNIIEDYSRPPEEQALEVYCNAVAGAALVPAEDLRSLPIVMNKPGIVDWPDDDIDAIKREFGVSRFVILRRLQEIGRASASFYRRRHLAWTAELSSISIKKDVIVPPHRMAISSAGRTFSRLVVRALHEDAITLSEAADFLGTKAKNIAAIEGEVF